MNSVENDETPPTLRDASNTAAETCQLIDALMQALDHVTPDSPLEDILLSAIQRAAQILDTCGQRSA